MKSKTKKLLNSFKCLFLASALLLVFVASSLPAYAEITGDASDRLYYKLDTAPGEYAYGDYSNSRYFVLNGSQITVFDAASGAHGDFYNFKNSAKDPSSFKFYDLYGTGSKLYYLYQSGGSSFVTVVDFERLSVFVNELGFPCTSVMATEADDILVYTSVNKGMVFVIKSDGTTMNASVSSPIVHFYGEDEDGNIYYQTSNGLTFASYDRKSFTPSNRKLTDVTADLSKNNRPVEIINKNLLADYTGNVFELNNGSTRKIMSFERKNYSPGYSAGIVAVPNSNILVGAGDSKILAAYNRETNKIVSSAETRHNIYSVIMFGFNILCFEKDSSGSYIEIIPLNEFVQLNTKVLNLNDESVYAGRSSADVASKYSRAVREYDFTAPMLSDNGSAKAPYARSVMTKEAQNALLDFSNYQRWLAGLSEYRTGSSTIEDTAAKGAILLSASPVKGHYPPKPNDMNEDFYKTAYIGTGGNISYGYGSNIAGGIASIRALTNDLNNLSNRETVSSDGKYYNGYNTPGHRNSFLQRGGSCITYGAADGILLQYYEYAQNDPNHSGTFTQNNNNEAAYAWPAPGAFPYEEISPGAMWTVYLNTDSVNTGFGNLDITVTDLTTGEEFIRNTVMHDADGQREGYSITNYWGKSISFTPPKTYSYDGKSYKVTIKNLVDANGMPATIEYTINMFGYTDTFMIDGAKYRLTENGELVPAAEPTTEPVTTVEPTTEPVTTVEPTTEPVTTVEPTSEPVTTVEPTTEPVTTVEPTTEPATSRYVLIGDVNLDGKVNGLDAGILQRYVSGWDGYRDKIKSMEAADVNRNGSVNGADAGVLARYASGWEEYSRFIVRIEIK